MWNLNISTVVLSLSSCERPRSKLGGSMPPMDEIGLGFDLGWTTSSIW
jgi:hypothetical protein